MFAQVENTVLRQRAAGIPQDVQFVDIDYMRHHEDFTYDHVCLRANAHALILDISRTLSPVCQSSSMRCTCSL